MAADSAHVGKVPARLAVESRGDNEILATPFSEREARGDLTSQGKLAEDYCSAREMDYPADTDLSPSLQQCDALMQRYPSFLRGQRGLSQNTVRVYMADLASFREYLSQEGVSLADMERSMLRGYLAWLATCA